MAYERHWQTVFHRLDVQLVQGRQKMKKHSLAFVIALLVSTNAMAQMDNIVDHICNDIKMGWRYNSMDDLFKILPIAEEDIIRGYRVIYNGTINDPNAGVMYSYTMEYGCYKLNISAYDDISKNKSDLLLRGIEIELNDKNYLHLFPYKTMNEYMRANNFGRRTGSGSDYIQYMVPGEEEYIYCYLRFKNGFLESIQINSYW
jgi:hypothetical protein